MAIGIIYTFKWRGGVEILNVSLEGQWLRKDIYNIERERRGIHKLLFSRKARASLN